MDFTGTPAMGMASSPLLREVRVRPSSRDTRTASSKNISKKSPMRKNRMQSGCSALAAWYCFIIGV